MTAPCGCPDASRIVSLAKHAAWHELCVQQGIPPGPVCDVTVRAARGQRTSHVGPTQHDQRAYAQGKSSPAWRRR